MQINLWTLAAGLLAIPALSDAMLWIAPPPEPAARTHEEASYDNLEVALLNELVARKPSKSERATYERKQVENAQAKRDECGEDFACLIAWAERSNPYGRRP